MGNNTINVNNMTKTYYNMMQCCAPKGEKTSSFTDHYHSSNYSILHFGATEEESYGESVSGGSPFMEKEEGFWDRRARRREKLQEQYEEMLDQKAIAEQLGQPFIFTPDLFDSKC